ncbi:hypothetical protein OS493_038446 [Desmophyllum pertusum]|uniref:Uncharacterized protein n=1 Tax=Desmophyllum pertusum TaxID=174260 RepID=A0A9W9ZI05_9CNID|nr:hypothetical protein OS493_038446 [Desmophyllum pertusum]
MENFGSFTVDRVLDLDPTVPWTIFTTASTSVVTAVPSTILTTASTSVVTAVPSTILTTASTSVVTDANWIKQRMILHAIYSTVIFLLVVIIIVLVFLLWRRRSNQAPGNDTG